MIKSFRFVHSLLLYPFSWIVRNSKSPYPLVWFWPRIDLRLFRSHYINIYQKNRDHGFDYTIKQPYVAPHFPLVSFQEYWECFTALISLGQTRLICVNSHVMVIATDLKGSVISSDFTLGSLCLEVWSQSCDGHDLYQHGTVLRFSEGFSCGDIMCHQARKT